MIQHAIASPTYSRNYARPVLYKLKDKKLFILIKPYFLY